MTSSAIGGYRFREERIEPFGVQWTPDRSVDLQKFAEDNTDKLKERAREDLIITIPQTHSSPGQEWQTIQPAGPTRSTQGIHAEYSGSVSMLIWKLLGKNRRPTSFTRSSDAAMSMLEHRNILRIDGIDTGKKEFVPHLRLLLSRFDDIADQREVIENAMRWLKVFTPMSAEQATFPTPDVSAPHDLLWQIDKDDGFDALPKRDLSIVDRGIDFIMRRNRAAETAERARVKESVRSALMAFNNAVIADLAPNTYQHNWSAQPNSGLIAWNNITDLGDTALHFATPHTDNSDQDLLIRVVENEGGVLIHETGRQHIWTAPDTAAHLPEEIPDPHAEVPTSSTTAL